MNNLLQVNWRKIRRNVRKNRDAATQFVEQFAKISWTLYRFLRCDVAIGCIDVQKIDVKRQQTAVVHKLRCVLYTKQLYPPPRFRCQEKKTKKSQKYNNFLQNCARFTHFCGCFGEKVVHVLYIFCGVVTNFWVRMCVFENRLHKNKKATK